MLDVLENIKKLKGECHKEEKYRWNPWIHGTNPKLSKLTQDRQYLKLNLTKEQKFECVNYVGTTSL